MNLSTLSFGDITGFKAVVSVCLSYLYIYNNTCVSFNVTEDKQKEDEKAVAVIDQMSMFICLLINYVIYSFLPTAQRLKLFDE